MKTTSLKFKIVKAVVALIGILLCYLAFADISVVRIISKNENGDVVASMGPGWVGALLYLKNSEMETNRLKYKIYVIEYRSYTGKTLARFKPTFAPHDDAKAQWTEKFVLISSELNGECPMFVAFDRFTGEKIKDFSDELLALPAETRLAFDPCGIGRNEHEELVKKNRSPTQ